METTAIVVGTDGTASSEAAVRWAAQEAVRRNVALRVVHAFEWNWQGARYNIGTEFIEMARRSADAVTADALAQAVAAAPTVQVEAVPVLGNPAPQLMEAATKAAMVVLGNRGRGGFASLLLGSVSQQLATHAPCPVVIVRGRTDAQGPVVVGLEDSPTAQDVLQTGFELAAARGCDLLVVRTYLPPMPLWIGAIPAEAYPMPEEDATQRQQLDELLAPWRQKYPEVRTQTLVSRHSAAGVLVDASQTAQVVVVGSHGHGAIAGTLLGSTGLQLLHHADCPVLVARTRHPG